MLKAVLIDIGGPILDEDGEYAAWDNFLLTLFEENGERVGEEEFSQAVLSAVQCCYANPRARALWQFVQPDVPRFRRLWEKFRTFQENWIATNRKKRIRPDVWETISALADRYVLALAGNQPAHVARFLAEEHLLHYFRWQWVSEEMGVQKPDPLFFQMILDGLSVRPEEAVMVGDRLDLDILPAKLVGIKTVRILVGPYAEQLPLSFLHCPDQTISALSMLPAALAQLDPG